MNMFVFEHFTAIGGDPNIRAEGVAMRDAVAEDLAALSNVEVSTLELETGQPKKLGDLVRRFEEASCQAGAIWVIAPETSGYLSRYTQIARRRCPLVLNATPSVIEWASNKNRTAELLKSLGVPHAQSVKELGVGKPPYIVKPVDGAGGMGVTMIKSPDQARDILVRKSAQVRLERFHPGIPASVGILCHPTHPVLLAPTRQRFREGGSFEYEGGELLGSSDLTSRAHHLVGPLLPILSQCRGWIGIDLILGADADGASDVVVEVNPRLTSSYFVHRAACQQNLAGVMLAAIQPDALELI